MAHDSFLTFGRREGQDDFPSHLISGIPSFLKTDVVPPLTDRLVAHGAKAAVLGLPWEHTNTCRPGTSMGPRAIRAATDHYISHHGEFQVDLFDALGLVDCGDVQIIPGNARRTFDRDASQSTHPSRPRRRLCRRPPPAMRYYRRPWRLR